MAGSAVVGAAIGAGLGSVVPVFGTFLGGIAGGIIGTLVTLPVNMGIARLAQEKYNKDAESMKSALRHLEEFERHKKSADQIIQSKGDADKAGSQIYKSAHHIAKVKTAITNLRASLDEFEKAIPDDAALRDYICSSLISLDRLNNCCIRVFLRTYGDWPKRIPRPAGL